MDKLIKGLQNHFLEKDKPMEKTETNQNIEEKPENGLVDLILSDGKVLKLKIGDELYFENIKYKINGQRTTKDGTFLIKASNEEAQKAFEITSKDLKKKFNIGEILLPVSEERIEELNVLVYKKRTVSENEKKNDQENTTKENKKQLETEISDIEIKIVEMLKELKLKEAGHLDNLAQYVEKIKGEAKTKEVLDFLEERIGKILEAKKLLEKQDKLKGELKILETTTTPVETPREATELEPKNLPPTEEVTPTSVVEPEKISKQPTEVGTADTRTSTEEVDKTVETEIPQEEPKEPTKEEFEIKEYSTEYLKEKINSLLKRVESVKEINKIEPKIINNEVILDVKLIVGDWGLESNVTLNAVLENKNDNIAIKNYNINATSFEKKIKKRIEPFIGKISTMLTGFMEEEEGKKVEKIEIKNGALKVTFKK